MFGPNGYEVENAAMQTWRTVSGTNRARLSALLPHPFTRSQNPDSRAQFESPTRSSRASTACRFA